MPSAIADARLVRLPAIESRTIVFFPEGAFGPTNNCVGIGDVLHRRGHRVVFVAEESFAGARYVDDRLTEIFDGLAPDVIVEDNVCSFAAIPASGRPWVRIVSCNPLEL